MDDAGKILPIGSVITLRGGKKKLMIFGIQQTSEGVEGTYDYVGVLYPEGNLGKESQFLFNHEDIETVHFTGFEDEERKAFMETMAEFFSEKSQATTAEEKSFDAVIE